MRTLLPCHLLSVVLATLTPTRSTTAAETAPAIPAAETEAVDVVRDVMRREQGFVKVHAAEALIELGASAGVQDVFIAQEREHRSLPMYRLGVWRVLARLAAGTPEHDRWVGHLRTVAVDPAAPDRIGAIESLAKLKYVLQPDERPVIEALAASDEDDGVALFSIWLLAQTPGSENPQDRVVAYLDSKDPITRLRALYILRFLPNLTAANLARLKAAARAEAKGTLTYAYATSSSFIVARTYDDHGEARRARGELSRILKSGEPAEKQEACRALGEHGSREDLGEIAPLLTDAAPPARVGAGLATTRIIRRRRESPSASRRRDPPRDAVARRSYPCSPASDGPGRAST